VRLLKRTLSIVSVFSVGALLLLTCAAAIFCQVTLHVVHRLPVNRPPTAIYPGAVWRTVTITARDGAELEAWFVTPGAKPSGRCVAVLHGIADSKSSAAWFAPMFLAEGYSVLLPDSRAHGRSGGESVTYGLLEKYDVIGWAAWMRGAGCTEIYGLGESLGASILIQAAAVAPAFRAIVAECPFADLAAAGEIRTQRILPPPGRMSRPVARVIVASGLIYARLRYGLDFRQVSPVQAMARTNTPILLIHGLEDRETPYWHSQRLAAANPIAVLWLVPHAGHVRASATDPGGFRMRVLEWFGEHRAGARAGS